MKQGFAKPAPFRVGPPSRRDVTPLRVGGEVEDVGVAAGGQDHGVGRVGLDPSAHQVPNHHALGHSIHHDDFHHLMTGEDFNVPGMNLFLKSLIAPQQELLARLAPGIEGPGNLGASEGPVGQEAAVFPGEGHTLSHGLIDDVQAHLGQAVHVGLPGPEVPALHRVVEEAEDAVAVILVVLGAR